MDIIYWRRFRVQERCIEYQRCICSRNNATGGNWIDCHCRPRATKNICSLQPEKYLLLAAMKRHDGDLYNKIILADQNLATQASFRQISGHTVNNYLMYMGIYM